MDVAAVSGKSIKTAGGVDVTGVSTFTGNTTVTGTGTITGNTTIGTATAGVLAASSVNTLTCDGGGIDTPNTTTTTLLNISATDTGALPDGQIVGQIKIIHCTVRSAGQYTLTPTNLNGHSTILFNHTTLLCIHTTLKFYHTTQKWKHTTQDSLKHIFSCLRSLTYCWSARDGASNPLKLSRNRTPIDIITTSTRVSRRGDERPPPGARRASSRAGGSLGAGSLDSTRPRTGCQVSADGSPHTKHWFAFVAFSNKQNLSIVARAKPQRKPGAWTRGERGRYVERLQIG